ncbi:hypothetical protein FRX31_032522 [Thalictrum thalictroides]|uniref:F-box associated beta-propeller type 3 domain-containing protein n=1 Tax=Thalictrum thalictroides TaxID=46969 RepID=A0A7J6V0G5_THATH|nr:hypothetical protein FRX31_032522 [Thalictrum thalictroides]
MYLVGNCFKTPTREEAVRADRSGEMRAAGREKRRRSQPQPVRRLRLKINGSTTTMASFPEEVVVEILSWLPIKSIVRFRDNIIIPCSPIPSYFNQHNNKRKRKCSTSFGFGFHHATQEYKVIRVVFTHKVFQSHVSVYTLGTPTWRSLESILDAYGINRISDHTAVLVNGALHFLAARPVSTFFDVILSFDVKDEVFQVISPPNLEAVRLGELGRLLSLSFPLKDVGIDIWIMQEHGVVVSWTNLFKIKLPGLNTFLKLGALSHHELSMESGTSLIQGKLKKKWRVEDWRSLCKL